jgi:hypothetical protein
MRPYAFFWAALLCCLGFVALAQSQPLADDKLEEQDIIQSFDEALKAPDYVYRLFLCNTQPAAQPNEISKLTLLQELYLDEKQVPAFSAELPKLPNLQKLYVLVVAWTEADKKKLQDTFPKLRIIYDF